MCDDHYGHHHHHHNHHHHRPRVEVDYNMSLYGGYEPGYYPPNQTTVYNQPPIIQPAGVYVPQVAPIYSGQTVVTQTTAPSPGMFFCETRRRWVPRVEFGVRF